MVKRRSGKAEFVVRGNTSRLRRVLQNRADFDIVGKLDDGLIISFQLKRQVAPRQLWEAVRDKLTTKQLAAPVLVDRTGSASFPTGRLVVRFHADPTPGELKGFARKFKLKLVEQNKLQPKQASFVAKSPRDTFLPDLVASVSRESQVRTAWPEAQASYRRTVLDE